jgi:hypothetical protein
MNTLHGTNKQRMSIQRTKVIMPVITWENGFIFKCYFMTKLNSVALVRERTIPTERPPPVGDVIANFCG